jgi:hypothetical protein
MQSNSLQNNMEDTQQNETPAWSPMLDEAYADADRAFESEKPKSTNTQHTPTPLNAEHVSIIYHNPGDPDGIPVTIIGDNLDATQNNVFAWVPDEATAKRFVRAVDNHEALVKALEDLLVLFGDYEEDYENGPIAQFEQARAALAAAKGGEE